MIDLGLIKKEDDRLRLLEQENQNHINISRRIISEGDLDPNKEQVKGQRSGGSLPNIYLAHVDKYG